MTAICIHDIEESLRNSDPQKRQDTLRALTDLFLSAAPRLNEDGVGIFDAVFDVALKEPSIAALTDISMRVAPVPNAPSRLIKRLATDVEISVAGPVLSQSPRLSEEDLCKIASVRGNSHLLAISTRRTLTSPVTDILIDRGDNEVARNIAGNETAELSDRGVARLLERAQSDETIGAGLYMRSNLRPDVLRDALTNAVSRREEDTRAKIAAAQRLAVTLKQAGELTEFKINVFAAEGRYEELIASISLLSRLKFQLIESMMHGHRLGGLTLVCKSLGYNITTMNAVWNLAVSHNGATPDDIRNARKDFLAVSKEIAERVIRFWLVRQSAGAH